MKLQEIKNIELCIFKLQLAHRLKQAGADKANGKTDAFINKIDSTLNMMNRIKKIHDPWLTGITAELEEARKNYADQN